MTTMDIMKAAKAASKEIALLNSEKKNAALYAMAEALEEEMPEILRANREDMDAARAQWGEVMLDRLKLDEKRIRSMASGMRDVAGLADPVGRKLETHRRADGLVIEKVSVPLGVVAIIYESRPNVTSDAAALALKSGNAAILRSGKEAHRSAEAIAKAMRNGLLKAGVTPDAVLLVEDTSRESASALMTGNGYVDLLIPRGGKGLIAACVSSATVPCIETGTGICHIYVDEHADFEKALKIIDNAKTSRPSVCNAAEVCLINEKICASFVPLLERRLTERTRPVELRMDKQCLPYAKKSKSAEEGDFDTEFLDYILAVGAVKDVEEAIRHIARHSTGHSEAIVTEDAAAAERFVNEVDSAAVYVNASTRFTDGGEFGLGCEMGISTQKLHARGPMGLCELNTYKYIVRGDGHTR